MASPWPRTAPVRIGTLLTAVFLPAVCTLGCGSPAARPVPEGRDRITKLLNLYKAYVQKNKQGPPGEQALREFGQKLSPEEREAQLIGNDLDAIFTSPRDNQKYEVRYGLKLEPGGKMTFVAWEATGQNGRRFVALSNGYVEEYSEESFKRYQSGAG
jgi:hypothetical protein